MDDHELAAQIAREAGRLLVRRRAEGASKGDGDRESNELILARLAESRPGDAVLSEESKDDPIRLERERVWIVDPLDGTREFGEPGRVDWAVHVALWARDTPAGPGAPAGPGDGDLIAGAVALPAQGRVLSTAAPTPLTGPDEHHPPRMVVSRSRASDLVKSVAALIKAELVPWGSAGAKVATVVLGENDVYLHSGGFYEWDTAAPVAVARASGFHVSRVDGSPAAYNQEDPLLPDILVCRPAIAPVLLDAIREATHAI
jgi:3'(2'), 5'-bisphosphate nucleotidase